METGLKIMILGSGNVATHLARALSEAGHHICGVYSRNLSHARRLATTLWEDCVAVDSIDGIADDADVYLLAVSDDAIPEIMKGIGGKGESGIWCHTAGSVGMAALDARKKRGVFYPLQTFSRMVDVNVREVPFIIEGSDENVTARLEGLARTISDKVTVGDSETRRAIHVAAVFACNFPNHLWAIAERLLNDAGLDLSLLHPLMRVTLDKALHNHPRDVMTGPAKRGDRGVIEGHLRGLDERDAAIYELLSRDIMRTYHSGGEELTE